VNILIKKLFIQDLTIKIILMRIISAFLILRIIFWLILPQIVLATGNNIAFNETNIKNKIENNFLAISKVNEDSYLALRNKDNNEFEGFVQIKRMQEQERERVIEKLRKKVKGIVFPQGKFIINASAYTAAADECGKSDGITASGLKVRESETIACPYQFPFGTKINIDGMGTYICEDRGGAIKGNHIDIYMKTKKQAFTFGRRYLLAQIVM
jgi:3D (Asp-Asp-Asp) domain-containing protein